MMKKLHCTLLVDDDVIDNVINRRIIKKLDVSKEVKTVTNGLEGLDYLSGSCSVNTKCCPQLIFLDINMPVMKGTEFLHEFNRLQFGINIKAKIVILTSYTSPEELEKAQGYDILDILYKPLTEEKLQKVLNRAFH